MHSNIAAGFLIAVYLGFTAYAVLALPPYTHAGTALAGFTLPR